MAWVQAKDFGRSVGIRYLSSRPGDPEEWSIDIDDAYKFMSPPVSGNRRDYDHIAVEVD